MENIVIDEEFRKLIPALQAEEYALLEKSILAEGVREPLILWNGILVDGHNRHEIAQKHGVPFRTISKDFAGRDDVKIWIINNQLGRRNISAYDRSRLILQLEPMMKAKAKERQGSRTDLGNIPQKSAESRDELAKAAGVSHDTIAKVKVIEQKAPEEMKQKLSSGEMSINQAYNEVTNKVHVSNNSGNNEWYTPPEFIAAAVSVMGSIDCDPASSEVANKTVKALTYYTEADNGLSHEWAGRVWMNPPYAQPLIMEFCEKLAAEIEAGNVTEACVLVNNGTETAWFQRLLSIEDSVCFPKSRIKFIDMDGNPSGAPLQGQAVIYHGPNSNMFRDVFRQFGAVLNG